MYVFERELREVHGRAREEEREGEKSNCIISKLLYIMLKHKQYFQYKLKHQLFDLSTFL